MRRRVKSGLGQLVLWAVLVASGLSAVPANAAAPTVNPSDYPSLSVKDIGHVRHMVRLAGQLPGDWSGMGSDWWDIGERSLQYELAFMTYTLGIVAYDYTPAYRELTQKTMDRLIEKMMVPDVWETWINGSRGGRLGNPAKEDLVRGWTDPVKKYNIMMKGHLLQMAAMYEMLFHDFKYDKPGAFTFSFKANTWGNGPETFKYDLPELARIVHQEYVDSDYEGVQCEPNRVFPMCNQHAVLGLIQFDQTHGTDYGADVGPKFMAAWQRKGYTDPKTKSQMLMRLAAQDRVIHGAAPWADGWTGIFMHAWQKDYINALYPTERDRHLNLLLKGDGTPGPDNPSTDKKIGFGMFAAYAAEVGDTKTVGIMLDFADKNFNPLWVDGEYYYPRSDAWKRDKDGVYHGVDVLTGNALLAMARINTGNGLWRMYSGPRGKAFFANPYISNVDYLTANVSQAVYDDEKHALIVTLTPGPVKAALVSFKIRQLNRGQNYLLLKDNKAVGHLGKGKSGSKALAWQTDGSLLVVTDMKTPHSFVLIAEQ